MPTLLFLGPWLRLLVTVLLALVWSPQLCAQTIIDPRLVEFTPSPDHDASLPDGHPSVERYDLKFYYLGALQPFQVMNLGKPSPDLDGKIRVDFVRYLLSWPLPGISYEARVAAIGPTGVGQSAPSNSFAFSGPCGYVLSSNSASYGANGGSGNVGLSTSPDCLWTATSSANWVGVVTDSGSGPGTILYTVAANSSTNSRTGTLSIGDASLTITQAGGSGCSFTISPTSASVTSAGGSGLVSVTSSTGCAWTAKSNVTWITISSGSGGTGSGTVSFTVAANTGTTSRTGTLTIAGKTMTITQGTCPFSISPTSQSFGASGGTASVGVKTTTGCGWQAKSGAAWISITAGASGTGTGNVTYAVATNSGTTSRTGTLTIAGKTMTVTQTATSSQALLPWRRQPLLGDASNHASYTRRLGVYRPREIGIRHNQSNSHKLPLLVAVLGIRSGEQAAAIARCPTR